MAKVDYELHGPEMEPLNVPTTTLNLRTFGVQE